MDTILPNALTLAAELRAGNWAPNVLQNETALRDRAADELERLHAENETLRTGYDAARLEIAGLQAQLEAVGASGLKPLIGEAQAQPAGAVPAKVLAGVIELARAAHAHWDADRDAKVGKILMAMAGWNEGYDWRADALHAAATAHQPAAQALDAPVSKPDPRLTAIEQAIRDHHFALDTRKHGGIAAANALDAICTAMDMPWIQGAESARRAAIAAQQGGQ